MLAGNERKTGGRVLIGKRLTEGSVRRFDPVMEAGLVLLFPHGLLARSRDGTTGQATVRVTVGTDVAAPVAAGRGTFQDCLMHRQDCRDHHANRITVE